MKIKKLLAKTIKEGKEKVIRELGEDAVILSHRTVIDPKTQNELVEIVAAIDESQTKNEQFERITLPRPAPEKANSDDKYLDFTAKLLEEISKLNTKVDLINEQVRFHYLNSYPEEFKQLFNILVNNEVNYENVLNIISMIYKNYPGANPIAIKDEFAKIVSHRILFDGFLQKDAKQQVVMFVGPAGAGKSINLIKMASIAKLGFDANISIISTDTYKVSGLEQMQTYSSIAAIPFSKADDLVSLQKQVSRDYDKDMIFIDTIGKSIIDETNLTYLSEIAQISEANKVYLVLPSNLSAKNYEKYIESFKKLNISGLIITKIDETNAIGPLFDILLNKKIPISYFSTGQNVPDDIERANAEMFVNLLMRD
jgi:flagellar biosynthesis protein FlhF